MAGARFGPAGKPVGFKSDISSIPKYLSGEELNAFEYQAVRWGDRPQIDERKAVSLGEEAEKYGVKLSVHASYFINLSGKPSTVEASLERLKAALTAASWMKASIVVFHPGYYGGKPRSEALKTCFEALKKLVDWMEGENLKDVAIGLETTGKRSQLGSLEEVVELSKELEYVVPVVDWAHLYARSLGSLGGREDFVRILDFLEGSLGSDYLEDMHCHYSRIEYGRTGERRHRNFDEEVYGPDFTLLASTLIEAGVSPTFICETPLLDLDAVKMKRVWIELGGKV